MLSMRDGLLNRTKKALIRGSSYPVGFLLPHSKNSPVTARNCVREAFVAARNILVIS